MTWRDEGDSLLRHSLTELEKVKIACRKMLMNNACNQDVVVTVWQLAALNGGAHAGLGISLCLGRI